MPPPSPFSISVPDDQDLKLSKPEPRYSTRMQPQNVILSETTRRLKCHPDRESGATPQSVIPTERAERLPNLSSRPRERSERVEGSMVGGYWKLATESHRASCFTAATQPRRRPIQAIIASSGTDSPAASVFPHQQRSSIPIGQRFVGSAGALPPNPQAKSNHHQPPPKTMGWRGGSS